VAPDKLPGVLNALETQPRSRPDQERLGRPVVSHDDDDLFVYTDAETAARQLRGELEESLRACGLDAPVSVERWHPEEERWEDLAVPLPSTPAERERERERRREEEVRESADHGKPDWEVRITLPTHHDARAFAQRLEAEGIPVTRQWRHLVVGANDEDQAATLVERLRAEAPEGSELVVEGSAAEAMKAYWRRTSRFAWMFSFLPQ